MSPRIKREELKRDLYIYTQTESLRNKFKTEEGYNYCMQGKNELESKISDITAILK